MGGSGTIQATVDTHFLCLDWLATERRWSLTARGFKFFLHFTFYLSLGQYLFHLASYVGHWVCLFLCWGTYIWHCVCLFFVGLMLDIGFVSLLVGCLMFGIALSVICVTYVGHWVCLFVGWGTYV